MFLPDNQKYTMAMAEEKLKAKKREMFSQVPGSILHAIKVIAYENMLADTIKAKIFMNAVEEISQKPNWFDPAGGDVA